MIAIALLLELAASLVSPTSARCPRGWYAEGVRPSGVTRCILDDGDDYPGGANDGPIISLPMRVYCQAGTRPIALRDMRTVSCVDNVITNR